MSVVDDSQYRFTFTADHDQDLDAIDASVLGARRFNLDHAMWTFHIGTSDLANADDL